MMRLRVTRLAAAFGSAQDDTEYEGRGLQIEIGSFAVEIVIGRLDRRPCLACDRMYRPGHPQVCSSCDTIARDLGLGRDLRRCVQCGCTDLRACVDPATGEPCDWISPFVCSACEATVRAQLGGEA